MAADFQQKLTTKRTESLTTSPLDFPRTGRPLRFMVVFRWNDFSADGDHEPGPHSVGRDSRIPPEAHMGVSLHAHAKSIRSLQGVWAAPLPGTGLFHCQPWWMLPHQPDSRPSAPRRAVSEIGPRRTMRRSSPSKAMTVDGTPPGQVPPSRYSATESDR
jgi:hypothetical protein